MDEILKYAIENGMLDLEYVRHKIDMERQKDVMNCHKYKTWQGKDGYWYTYLPKQPKGRKLIKKKTSKELEQCIYDFYEENNEISFKNVVNRWLDDKVRFGEITKQTYDRYKADVDRFLSGTRIFKKDISNITEYELEEFIKSTIVEMKLSAKAFSGLRTLIRGAFKYAYRRQWTTISITEFFDNLDLSQKMFQKRVMKNQVFTNEEVRKIEKWIWEHDNSITNLSILLGFYTGLRVGEISALQHDDIDFDNNVLNVNKTEIKYKGPKGQYVFEVREDAKTEAGNRYVVLNDKAIKVLKRIIELNPDCEYLIVGDKGRVKGMFITLKLYYICDSLGINRKSMHKTRKTYCTKMIDSNVSEALIISQMGHTDIATAKSYYYFNNLDTSEAKKIINSAVAY